MIFISHDVSAITHLCERVILLDEGRILQDGLPHEVVGTFTSQFYENHVVAFHVVESLDGNSAHGDYPGRMKGVVRPLLQWNTRRIDIND